MAHIVAKLVVADLGDETNLSPESGCRDGNIRGRAADGLLERRDVAGVPR